MKWINDGDTKVPIANWASLIENDAILQAKEFANIDVVFDHISLMPDCLTIDTEILTSVGFKKIIEIDNSFKIANFDNNDKTIFFDNPKNVFKRSLRINEKVYEFFSTFFEKGIKCTEKHRMQYNKCMGTIAEEIPNKIYLEDFVWNGNGIKNNISINIKYELLCLIAWAVGDGNIKKGNKRKDGSYSSYYLRFGLKKDRKIKRILSLLNALDYKYNLRIDNRGITNIEVSTISSREIIQYIGINKEYPIEFIEKLSTTQAEIFLEEALKVDGDFEAYYKRGAVRYNSKRKSDIDFLSALISIHKGIANNSSREFLGFGNITKMNYLSLIDNKNIEISKNGVYLKAI